MATLKVFLNRHQVTPNGEYPIMLRVVQGRSARAIHMYQKVKYEEWDFKKMEADETLPMPEQRRNSRRINYHIATEMVKLKKIIMDMENEAEGYSLEDILKAYYGQSSLVSVFIYIDQVVEELIRAGKIGNANAHKCAANMLYKYTRGGEMNFNELNFNLLQGFEIYLRQRGCKVNTIAFYMRTIRSIYNRAIKDGIVSDVSYPFKKLIIKKEKTVKRAIYREDITAIKNLDLTTCLPLDIARDVFLFSFYTRGMSFKDIAFLKVRNIVEGRIYYSRQKTSQKLNIKLIPQSISIMLKYNAMEELDSYIFPLIRFPRKNEFVQYKNAYRGVNRNLKVIGRLIKLQVNLTTYVARHSWATIAKRSGIPTSVISEGLGHDSEKTTQIYLDSFENNVLDSANEIVSRI